jgi:PadR family transcriptional regulator, regulatory protein PadR
MREGIQNWVKQTRKGLLEYVLLRTVARGPVYAYELTDIVARLGFDVSPGTVYPALTRLRSEGWVGVRLEESSLGPPRKYYSITDHGVERLEEMTRLLRPMIAGLEKLIEEERAT